MVRRASIPVLAWAAALLFLPSVAAHATTDPAEVDAEHAGPPVEAWLTHQLLAYQTGLARFELEAVARTIQEESIRHDVSRDLILAVMRTESGFFNWARSSVGALGLMQIMPATGEMLVKRMGLSWSGERTLYDPVVNVRLGVAYLAELRDRYRTWDKALAAYNWGPGAIDRRIRGGRALPVVYATRVLASVSAPTAP
jgi:soluble lytic murein transglycosylase-like protein